MEIHLDYLPTPKQTLAHRARVKYILYGGAVGGGKSAWIVADALLHCLRWPGTRVGIYRWESANFKKTTYDALYKWVISKPELYTEHNKADYSITLINGSTIRYGGLKASAAVSGDPLTIVKSLEVNALYIDEASDVPKNVYDFACTRVPRVEVLDPKTHRWMHPPGRVAITSNPCMGWLKTQFVDKRLSNHVFIQSTAYDNQAHLAASYIPDLCKKWKSLPDWIDTFLKGDWETAIDDTCIILAPWLLKARRQRLIPGSPIELGVDVAAGGADKTVIVRRRGAVADILYAKQGLRDTMKTVDLVASITDRTGASAIKIDNIGIGKGAFDRLGQLGYPVIGMNNGMASDSPEAFANTRSQWYWELRTLLEGGRIQLPDSDEMINELGDIRYRASASGRVIQIEPKDKIKSRIGHSPDYADAVMYVFAGALGVSPGTLAEGRG